MANRPIITLTTDFGLTDPYVGTMKGVILSRAANAVIVDLSHQIRPQDIQAASLMLQHAYPFFPEGTVHLVVIDPGVGSDRNIIGLKSNHHFFIGPDNGVLTPFFETSTAVHTVTNKDLFLDTISNTFHGRDIMAPVAAHLATGLPIEQIGPSISVDQCKRIEPPLARISANSIDGNIINIDNFGNLRSSITASDLQTIGHHEKLTISIGFHIIENLSNSYAQGREHEVLALLDSQNHLEIAVRNGNAAERLNSTIGDRIVVRWT